MRVHYLAIVLLFLTQTHIALAQAVASGDEQRFTEEMQTRFAEADPSSRFAIAEALIVSIVNEEMQDGVINLHRIFAFCLQASVADCEASKAGFVARMIEKPVPPSRATLRVIVRDAAYVDAVRTMFVGDGRGATLFIRSIGSDLHVLLASDSPSQIALVTTAMLEEIGLTEEAAWEAAFSNTAAALPALPVADQLAASAIAYELPEYAASLLARPGEWRALAEAAGPDLFVTAVSDQFVFVGVLPPGENLDAFKRTVREDCAAQERCISPNLYRWRDGRWIVAP